jgi:hypothetical protein
MIGKSPGWAHSPCLTKFFPDLTNLLKFHSQGASQPQLENRLMEIKLYNKSLYLDFNVFDN